VSPSIYEELTLFLGFVRKHWAKGDVTDALDAFDRRVELIVNHDTAAVVHLNTNFIEVEACDNWTATDSNEDNICIQLEPSYQYRHNKRLMTSIFAYLFFLSAFRTLGLKENLSVPLLSASYLGVELEFDALLAKDPLELLPFIMIMSTLTGSMNNRDIRNLFIDACTTDATEEFNHSNFGSKATLKTSELSYFSIVNISYLQTLPSSRPITPPPMTTIFFGTSFSSRAPVDETIYA
jgi:hypothetical protein